MPGTNFRGWNLRDYLLNGSPTATLVENFPRDQVSTDLTASLVTAVMTSVAMPLQQGDTVTTIGFVSGATATGTPTNEWVALYSTAATPALIAQSVTVSTAWAANSLKAFTLATPYVVPTSGIYYASIMVAATVVPTLVGKVVGSTTALLAATGIVTGQPALAQNSGSALTTTAPATIATPTVQSVVPYCVIQ
jgi:hypothetical protein